MYPPENSTGNYDPKMGLLDLIKKLKTKKLFIAGPSIRVVSKLRLVIQANVTFMAVA